MNQIDYRLNAIHGLKMLSRHTELPGHEEQLIKYVVDVLEGKTKITKICESLSSGELYGYYAHNIGIDGVSKL